MSLENTLNKLRTDGNMSQERFAEVLGVSRQSVQKWESGACVPELDKLIRIAKHFGISLDALILGRDERFADDINFGRKIRPKYEKMSKWEIYCADLPIEYEQCIDEGLDLKEYGELFRAVSLLPGNDAKARIADVIFDIVLNAKTAEGYPYTEPSDLDGIRRLRRSAPALSPPDKSALEGKILGAWTGRICGGLLGKPIEGVRTDELIPFLKDCGNYPMHRYKVGHRRFLAFYIFVESLLEGWTAYLPHGFRKYFRGCGCGCRDEYLCFGKTEAHASRCKIRNGHHQPFHASVIWVI